MGNLSKVKGLICILEIALHGHAEIAPPWSSAKSMQPGQIVDVAYIQARDSSGLDSGQKSPQKILRSYFCEVGSLMLSFQKRSKWNVGGQEGLGKLAASLANFHTSVSQRTTKLR